jgi:hypothetical protein
MNAHFETSGTYPLSSEPAEGYGTDPLTRSGKIILTNALNHKFVIVTADGYEHTTVRAEATEFDDHSAASLKAAELVAAARAKQAKEKQVELVD